MANQHEALVASMFVIFAAPGHLLGQGPLGVWHCSAVSGRALPAAHCHFKGVEGTPRAGCGCSWSRACPLTPLQAAYFGAFFQMLFAM